MKIIPSSTGSGGPARGRGRWGENVLAGDAQYFGSLADALGLLGQR